jgi:hypothetical protein
MKHEIFRETLSFIALTTSSSHGSDEAIVQKKWTGMICCVSSIAGFGF